MAQRSGPAKPVPAVRLKRRLPGPRPLGVGVLVLDWQGMAGRMSMSEQRRTITRRKRSY